MREQKSHLTLVKFILWLILLLAALFIVTTLTVAWFQNSKLLNTVARVETPSKIAILTVDKEEMQQIDMTYGPEDVQGTTVTLERPICINSTADFYLELAYTTNIDGLTLNLYLADTAGKKTENTPISGNFLNQDETTLLADDSLRKDTYGDVANIQEHIQKNAQPLYWMSNSQTIMGAEESGMEDGVQSYNRYYLLEIQWDTDKKETDMLYLMATHSGAVVADTGA